MASVMHPVHLVVTRPYNFPVKPLRASWGLLRWRVERACKRDGGHWWHPEGMIDWYCCQCGAERDGMPQDGT